jgi:hypothetical protein
MGRGNNADRPYDDEGRNNVDIKKFGLPEVVGGGSLCVGN